uniref:Putative receptor n=1 Tax=uncultured bacterium Contig958 TaxID=1393635 RepID=W0FUT5_9BACT|nr:putative receptor [uncultured bacterium Contig958]
MSKPPLFFIVIIGLIVVAASFRFMQQRREKADNDMAPLQQKLVVVSNKREKPINDRRSRQQEVTPAGTSIRYEASFKTAKAEEWSRRFASTPSSTTP